MANVNQSLLVSQKIASDCPGIFASKSPEVPRYTTSGGTCTAYEDQEHYALSEKRRNQVKEGFLHAWNSYVENALGWDEIAPITGRPNNSWGATLFDSLDTLLIMDLKVEFNEAKEYVRGVNFNESNNVNFFETTIRYLGGLMSAYELSNEPILLTKAQELGTQLLKAFQSRSGYPYNFVDFLSISLSSGRANNAGWTGGNSILAEIGSFQLEFRRLSDLTKDSKYHEKGQKVIDMLDRIKTPYPGLFPIYLNPDTGKAERSSISFGALGDSFYEYLLKQYLMTGSKIDQYRRMYEASIDSMKKYMIAESHGQTYLSALDSDLKIVQSLEHLTCFAPGLLALGSKTLGRPDDMELAKKLVQTCYNTYATTKTGLGPENVAWYTESDSLDNLSPENARDVLDHGFYPRTPYYILRPETVESIFYLYRLTGDRKYQEWGWNIFSALEKFSRAKFGYSGLDNVQDPNSLDNKMESFFMAETMKYLYLLFSSPDLINLEEYVFTTEAHPLKIRQ
ncbi:glycoside hydrolase [Basidiobolus meristosporus CBS 931.73]|uniref:alpha-1,2-Mannosidase n=1 Tax=Basidiobolus meristosporus CBS 931.73 TaxID=1314790 RepID=A0A1Y1YXS3_9FUNG|nr:glycoside hydrolase [Basidiobolus meristosporus CBS 931.73]|eukprot:ORY02820.1 glycoside hydrolase [Basidiobolus meristosporus CBS 931.73]